MYKIVSKRELTNNIFLMDIEAKRVAKSAKPGQFIIIKNDEKGERIPLTIADYNEEELKKVSGNLYVTTNDGSYGFKGTGSDMLKELINNQSKKYDHAVIIGPMIMMKFTSMLTKELNIPTTVSLNPIMVDGTGMCGACRVTVGGKVKFACVDGPEFDGHLVNYDESMRRQSMYKTEEGNTHSHGGCGCGGNK